MFTHNHLLVLHMLRSDSQDYLLHRLPKDQGQAGQPVVFWIFPLLEYRSNKRKQCYRNKIPFFNEQLICSSSIFLRKRMKTSGWAAAASFHGSITMSLLFCTPKMFIVQCDHMVRKGSLGNSPTISREFPQFSLADPGFLSKSLDNWTSKQNKLPLPSPPTPLLVMSYLNMSKLPEKAGVRCSLVTGIQSCKVLSVIQGALLMCLARG